jgi:hypothetical protein
MNNVDLNDFADDDFTDLAHVTETIMENDGYNKSFVFLSFAYSPNHPAFQRDLSPNFISIFKIYDILNNARVPFYLHSKLIDTIGTEIVQNGIDAFNPEFKRKSFVRELCYKCKSPPPQVVPVHLETYKVLDHIHLAVNLEILLRLCALILCNNFGIFYMTQIFLEI